jgi:hypothetical protein
VGTALATGWIPDRCGGCHGWSRRRRLHCALADACVCFSTRPRHRNQLNRDYLHGGSGYPRLLAATTHLLQDRATAGGFNGSRRRFRGLPDRGFAPASAEIDFWRVPRLSRPADDCGRQSEKTKRRLLGGFGSGPFQPQKQTCLGGFAGVLRRFSLRTAWASAEAQSSCPLWRWC